MRSDNGAENNLKRIYHRSVRYSYAGSLMVMVNSVVDGMIISHFLGEQAAAAFGLVMPFFSLINLIPTLLRYSMQTRIGEYIGRGDTKNARHCLFVLMAAGAAAALPLILMLSLFRPGTLHMLAAGAAHSSGTMEMSSEYMLFLSASVLPIMLCSVLHPVMQLDGDIKRSPLAIWAGTAVNIAGDLICVLALHRGIAGIAAATDLSCFTELFVLLLHYRKKNCILRPVYSREAGLWNPALFSGGLPFMFRELTAFITGILLNRTVFGLAGETGVSALCIGNTMWLFLLPAAMAVSSTGALLGSVAEGESDREGIRMVFRMGVWYAFLPGTVLAVCFFAAAGPLSSFCAGSNPEGMAMTAFFLRCLAVSLPMTILCQAAVSHLTVTGGGRTATAQGILEGGAVLLAVSWILGMRWGIAGVWAARPAAALCMSLIVLVFMKAADHSDRGSAEIYHIETSAGSVSEAVRFSEQVREFCLSHGITPRLCSLAALCVEELACNTLQWGYKGKPNHGVDIRAVYENSRLTLRFRDSGRVFDPLLYTQQFVISEKDPAKNAGLRIISAVAADMRYSCIADCNIVLLRIC